MKRSAKRATSFLVALCLLLGSVGFAPGLANTTGSPAVAKAAVKTMYIKWRKVKVHKTKSENSVVVQTLKRDKKVQVLSVAGGEWVRIKTSSGKKGYVLGKQLSETKTKTRTLKAAKKEWKIIESALKKYNWKIFDDEGYKYSSNFPGHYRTISASKTNGEDGEGDYLYFQIYASTVASAHGGTKTEYIWTVYNEDHKIAHGDFHSTRESVLEQMPRNP